MQIVSIQQYVYLYCLLSRYFQEVLTSSRLASECNEIQLHADGNWSAHVPPPRAPQPVQPTAEPVTLISDDLGMF